MTLRGNRLGGLALEPLSMSCLSVLAFKGDVLLAGLGVLGWMQLLGEHEVTFLGPAN